MDSTQTNNKSTLQNDYKWRRFKVKYLAVSVGIILLMTTTVFIINQQTTCETSSKESWSQIIGTSTSTVPNISTTCMNASDRGEGISFAVLLIPIAIAIIGYGYLPKLYKYLSVPGSK